MVITLLRSYPKLQDGQRKMDKNNEPITVFVYRVTGTDPELAEYERIQTEAKVNTIKDSGGYLWFTTQAVGIKAKLKVSPKSGKIFADTTALDLAKSLAKQYGAVGMQMAKDILSTGFVSEDTPVEEDETVPNGKGIDDLD